MLVLFVAVHAIPITIYKYSLRCMCLCVSILVIWIWTWFPSVLVLVQFALVLTQPSAPISSGLKSGDYPDPEPRPEPKITSQPNTIWIRQAFGFPAAASDRFWDRILCASFKFAHKPASHIYTYTEDTSEYLNTLNRIIFAAFENTKDEINQIICQLKERASQHPDQRERKRRKQSKNEKFTIHQWKQSKMKFHLQIKSNRNSFAIDSIHKNLA